MKTLQEIYVNYQNTNSGGHGDKGTSHTYIDEYAHLLEPYRTKNSTIMEIGVAHGESLQMWNEYFTDVKIYGVDITFQDAAHLIGDPAYTLIEEDASSEAILKYLNGVVFDVIIDDGSHKFEHQVASFNLLKNKMNAGGIYVIEDILDLDNNIENFKALHNNCTIIDNRYKRNLYADVLIVYRF